MSFLDCSRALVLTHRKWLGELTVELGKARRASFISPPHLLGFVCAECLVMRDIICGSTCEPEGKLTFCSLKIEQHIEDKVKYWKAHWTGDERPGCCSQLSHKQQWGLYSSLNPFGLCLPRLWSETFTVARSLGPYSAPKLSDCDSIFPVVLPTPTITKVRLPDFFFFLEKLVNPFP